MQRKLQRLVQTTICSLILLGYCLCSRAQGLSFDWGNQIGGNAMASYPNQDGIDAITTDDAGNVYVAGDFVDTVDFDPGPGIAELSTAKPGKEEAFLAKYDAEGNYLWAIKLADSVAFHYAISPSLAIDSFDNVYIGAVCTGTGDFDPGPDQNQIQSLADGTTVIAKYDAEGHYIWANALYGISDGNIETRKLSLDHSGHIYLAGSFTGVVDFDPDTNVVQLESVESELFPGFIIYLPSAFIARYDTSGNYQWVKSIDLTGNGGNLGGMALDAVGNIYITGAFTGTVDFDPGPDEASLVLTNPGTEIYYLAKYDAAGNYLSAVKLDGTGYNNRYPNLTIDRSGGLYLTSSFKDTIDLDPGPGQALYFSGGVYQMTGFLAKYDTGLNYQWAVVPESNVGGITGIYANTVDERTGNIYVSGSFSRVVDFDPDSGGAELSTVTAGNPDDPNGFLACYDACGHYLWAGRAGGAQGDIGMQGLAIKGNALYAGGMFTDTVDINPLPDSVGLVAVGTSDGFLLKMNISRDTLTATGCQGSFSFNDKTYTASGIYFDTLTSSLGCDSIATLNLTIIPNPQLTLDNGTLTASDADSYQWLSCDANMTVPGASEQTYTPVISGSYAVITTTGGCMDTSECLQVEVTGVDELSPGNKVLLYPNPTHGMVQIQAEQSLQGMDIRLMNAVGQTMALYPNVSGKTYSFDMSVYASGMYYVEISKGGKVLLRKKVTKL